jgi:hypothetical protein
MPVLIKELDSVQPNIEKVPVSGIEVDSKDEAHWQGAKLILLEESKLTYRALHRDYLIRRPPCLDWNLNFLTHVEHGVDISWRLSQGNALLGCDVFLIQPHDQLAYPSQGVLLRFVVVIEPYRPNAITLS